MLNDNQQESVARALCDNLDARLIAEQGHAPSYDDSEQHIQAYWLTLADAIDALYASRIEALTEALRPFAEAAAYIEDAEPARASIWEHPVALDITIAHLRNARKVLPQ